MGVFHVFKIVQMVPNRAKHYIYMNAIELISLKKHRLIPGVSEKCVFPCNNNWVVYFAE